MLYIVEKGEIRTAQAHPVHRGRKMRWRSKQRERYRISRRCRHNRGILLFFIVALVLAGAGVSPASAQPTGKKQVLVLHSYHPGMAWAELEQEGIEDVLQGDAPVPVELCVEYMDTKRHTDEAYLSSLADFYSCKFRNRTFDTVIACDDAAFAFVREHRDDLFAGVPIVFCGVNHFTDGMIRDDPLITGVVETINVAETLKIASRLQPDVRNVVVINDATTTGLANKKQILDNADDIPDTLTLTFLENRTMSEIQEYVSRLPDDTIVLLLTFNRDQDGTVYSYGDVADAIVPASSVPVYVVWDFYLNRGVVGGMVTSGYDQGRIAGEMALRILQGEPVSSIPVVTDPHQYPIFDYVQLEQFGLTESRLPTGSVILNSPATAQEIPVFVLAGAAGVLGGLVAIILALRNDIKRRSMMEERLRESEEKFGGIAQRSFDMIFTLDTEKNYTYVSPAVKRIMGYPPEYVTGRSCLVFMPPPFRQRFEEMVDRVMSGERVEGFQLETRRKDGGVVYLKIDASPIIKNGVIIGIQGVAHDITERELLKKREREAYAQIENNIEQFAILGDHIRNPLQVILALASLEDSPNAERIVEQVRQIDSIIAQLDRGWIESENIRRYLRRHYGLEGTAEPQEQEDPDRRDDPVGSP